MLNGLDHIQLAIPAGGEEAARDFYTRVLGLTEVAKPPALAGRGGLWLAGPNIALHLGVDPAFVPATKAHPAFRVTSLAAAKHHLTTQNTPYKPDADLPGITRVFICDPFGNRIELLERTLTPHSP